MSLYNIVFVNNIEYYSNNFKAENWKDACIKFAKRFFVDEIDITMLEFDENSFELINSHQCVINK